MTSQSIVSSGLAPESDVARWAPLEWAIVQAYFARDVHTFQDWTQSNFTDDSAWGRYYAALARFFAIPVLGGDHHRTLELAKSGLSLLDAMLVQTREQELEKLILDGCICGHIARVGGVIDRARYGFRALGAVRQAYKMAASHPRAVYVYASTAYAVARPYSRDAEEAFELLQRSQYLFEQPSFADTLPTWGHLNVLLYLAEVHLQRYEIAQAQQVARKLGRLAKGRKYIVIDELVAKVARA